MPNNEGFRVVNLPDQTTQEIERTRQALNAEYGEGFVGARTDSVRIIGPEDSKGISPVLDEATGLITDSHPSRDVPVDPATIGNLGLKRSTSTEEDQ